MIRKNVSYEIYANNIKFSAKKIKEKLAVLKCVYVVADVFVPIRRISDSSQSIDENKLGKETKLVREKQKP